MYRDRAKGREVLSPRRVPARPRPPLAFSIAEQDYLLGVLDSERFADTAPTTVFATLLDEGRYHGSVRTMYRLLGTQGQAGERRRQRPNDVPQDPQQSPDLALDLALTSHRASDRRSDKMRAW